MRQSLRIDKFQQPQFYQLSELQGELTTVVAGSRFSTDLNGQALNVFRYRKLAAQPLDFTYHSHLPLLVMPELAKVRDLLSCDGEILYLHGDKNLSVSTCCNLSTQLSAASGHFNFRYSGLSEEQKNSLIHNSILSLAEDYVRETERGPWMLGEYTLEAVLSLVHLALAFHRRANSLTRFLVISSNNRQVQNQWRWYLKFLFGSYYPDLLGDSQSTEYVTTLQSYVQALPREQVLAVGAVLNRNADLIPQKLISSEKAL